MHNVIYQKKIVQYDGSEGSLDRPCDEDGSLWIIVTKDENGYFVWLQGGGTRLIGYDQYYRDRVIEWAVDTGRLPIDEIEKLSIPRVTHR